ncbi:MAG: hypothetical protein ACOYLS_01390 [Polymorphobacter sp.]
MTGSLMPIAAALDDAEAVPTAPEAEAQAAKPTRAPPPATPKSDRSDSARSRRSAAIIRLELPDNLPVEPLGRNGTVFYYLDAHRQLAALAADKHGRAMIVQLFGDQIDILMAWQGKTDKDGNPVRGFHADSAADAFMAACSRQGLIDPAKQVRSVGAWSDEADNLILHLGDRVWMGGEYKPPGRYGDWILPAMPPATRPAVEAEGLDVGAEMLGLLNTWHWRDGLQAMLVLGWICQGFVTGALRWRTHIICDGERGTGKSSLLEMIERLFGNWLLKSSDVTPASIYQLMAGRAQPLFLDEFEAGMNPKRKAEVVGVLRQASSGGVVLRGGDDHIGRSFSVQFGAFLTSIVPVALQSQDESRMVRTQLLPLDQKADATGVMPDISKPRMAKMGARIMRRMIDQWPRFPATLAAYKRALEAHPGFDARLQDTYGTLLACADLMIHNTLLYDDDLAPIAADVARMVAPARAESDKDQDRCLVHLLQSQVDRGVGVRRTVASWLKQAAAFDNEGKIDLDRRRDAVAALGVVGLKPMVERDPSGKVTGKVDRDLLPIAQRAIVVCNEHPQLARIYHETPWPGVPGAPGSWVTVLRRVTGAEVPAQSLKIGGMNRRGTIVPVGLLIDWDEAP